MQCSVVWFGLLAQVTWWVGKLVQCSVVWFAGAVGSVGWSVGVCRFEGMARWFVIVAGGLVSVFSCLLMG